MGRYRKKPVAVEAVRYDPPWNCPAVWAFLGWPFDGKTHQRDCDEHTPLFIETWEGLMEASPGDWIIKGVAGEFYPCKPDIFEATYEPVDELHVQG